MRQTVVETLVFVFLAGVTLAHRLTMSNIHINWPSSVTPRSMAPWLSTFELSAPGISVTIEVSPDSQRDSQITFTTEEAPISAGVYVLKGSEITVLAETSKIRLSNGDSVAIVVPAPANFKDLKELLPTDASFQEKAMELFTMNKSVPRGVFTAQIMPEKTAYNTHRSYTVVGQVTPKADSER